MRFSDEFRDESLVREAALRLREYEGTAATIMEVCGTHTMSAARFGLRSLLPEGISLISGPGCPVCVTDQRDIDAFLAIGGCDGVVLCTFGDMVRVPGSYTSLERLRAEGADVRVVYSPSDAIDIAAENPSRDVVFFGVGFETTVPATAAAIRSANQAQLRNFYVYSCHKTMPPALRALLASGETAVSGLLLPGHVTTIIGSRAYEFIPREFGVPCAVAGFEPLDMLLGIEAILRQIAEKNPRVDNAYKRAVKEQPNERACELINDVFVPCDSVWRGIGTIAESGLEIAPKYSAFDAKKRFSELVESIRPTMNTSCRCGDVLRGAIKPGECALFGTTCTPATPVGPCMVSSEGACAAAYKYGDL
ncbi:MAG: hydrogenase formation protein HypD [Armatimonadota bacterium]|nr:hydrogenase formation protein HypD [Armatimonadota bacterium]